VKKLSANGNHLADTNYALKSGTRMTWFMELYSDSAEFLNIWVISLQAIMEEHRLNHQWSVRAFGGLRIKWKQSLLLDWACVARPSVMCLAHPICKSTPEEQLYIIQYISYFLLIHCSVVLINEQLALKVFGH